jgi:TolB-like protein
VEFAAALAAPATDAQETQAPSAHKVPWIAVLPFRTRSSDPALESFGDDLAEDIATGLSRYPLYYVVAASSTLRFKGRASIGTTRTGAQSSQDLGSGFIRNAKRKDTPLSLSCLSPAAGLESRLRVVHVPTKDQVVTGEVNTVTPP